jgi:hypothetical protein
MTGVHLEKGELSVRAVIGIVSFAGLLIIGFYTQVVIPIKEIQLGLAQVQMTLAEHNDKEQVIVNEVSTLEKRVTTMENRIKWYDSVLKLK